MSFTGSKTCEFKQNINISHMMAYGNSIKISIRASSSALNAIGAAYRPSARHGAQCRTIYAEHGGGYYFRFAATGNIVAAN